MSKPTIDQLAEMIDPPEEGGDLTTIPGYGRIKPSQARSEAIAKLRMIADALEAGKTIPQSAIGLAVSLLGVVQQRQQTAPAPDPGLSGMT